MTGERLLTTAWRWLPWAAVLVLLFTSIYLMSVATQDATRFGRYYTVLLVANGAALALLLAIIIQQTVRLWRHLKRGAPGARLTRRFVLVFLGLVVPPVVVVYLFSLELLHRGIDSWFDVRVEQALGNALTLSQVYLDENKRDLLARTRRAAAALREVPEPLAARRLSEWLQETDATQLTLFTTAGEILATASTDVRNFVPDYPEDVVLLIARQRDFYAALEPALEDDLKMRVLINLGDPGPFEPTRLLQAIFRVPEAMSALAGQIANQYERYQTLAYLRQPLKISFTITLSLVLALSLLLAMVMAFRAARRLVSPIRNLSQATDDVAAGHYGRKLAVKSEDELGFLVRSFNAMTGELDRSTRRAEESRREVESQRAYLEAVLSRLSSGVLSFDSEGRVRTINQAAARILSIDPSELEGRSLSELGRAQPQLTPLLQSMQEAAQQGRTDWRAEVILIGAAGRQVLMCRGARLGFEDAGQVVVFDDLTALIQAQRDAAWGEMARRLAHEVKNPLTPIQLSAERIRRRYLGRFHGEDAGVLDRATDTIVQQVEALKKLINAFSDYARAPQLQRRPLALHELISEVAELYSDNPDKLQVTLELDHDAARIQADPDRLRQLVHNLIKNAQEAMADQTPAAITLATRQFERAGADYLELTVSDRGPGFAAKVRDSLFEPYTTTKPKGTGLGLAIVRKIVEEHHGVIRAETAPQGGARIVIWLPLEEA